MLLWERTGGGYGVMLPLVDGDLRKGHLDLLMELKPAPGVAELLSGRSTLEQAIQTNSLPNLGFMA
jgi:MinD-like ATPase involved in chromosome partitioning or flagellar assembly